MKGSSALPAQGEGGAHDGHAPLSPTSYLLTAVLGGPIVTPSSVLFEPAIFFLWVRGLPLPVCLTPCPTPPLTSGCHLAAPHLASPPSPHPEPLLPSAQPGQFLQLPAPASPHHPDCPLPAPALISPGPLAPRTQLPGPRPCCLSHTMSPAWAWGTFWGPLAC